LEREIINATHKAEAIPIVEEAYSKMEDKRLLVLDNYLPVSSFLDNNEEILFVVSPTKDMDKWRVSAVQKEQFTNKKDLPKDWGGLRNEDLEKVTGVEGSVFCHRALFLAVAKTKESAIKLAKLALEN
jgi:uncharacterized UPF0160 family protein